VEVSQDDNDAVVEVENVCFLEDGDRVSTSSFFLLLSTEDDGHEELLLLVSSTLVLFPHTLEPTGLYFEYDILPIKSSQTDVDKFGIP